MKVPVFFNRPSLYEVKLYKLTTKAKESHNKNKSVSQEKYKVIIRLSEKRNAVLPNWKGPHFIFDLINVGDYFVSATSSSLMVLPIVR